MNENKCWELIETARQSACTVSEVPARLILELTEMQSSEIIGFGRILRDLLRKAYDLRLWAAATAICNYCSDDIFSDFCGWLIAQGKAVYYKALVDPDFLADIEDFDGDSGLARLAGLSSVPFKAYHAKTTETNFWDQLPVLPPPELRNVEVWDGETDSLERVVPRLFHRFDRKGFGKWNSTRQP